MTSQAQIQAARQEFFYANRADRRRLRERLDELADDRDRQIRAAERRRLLRPARVTP